MAMHCFQGVTVGFPAGAAAYGSQDDWQTADWVVWSTGDLRIDSASFALIFSPKGGGKLVAKPLGCLTSAAPTAPLEPGGLGAFVCTTSDPVHSLVKFRFQAKADEEAFAHLAETAEIACRGGRYPGAAPTPSRRSSLRMTPRTGESRYHSHGLVEAVAAQVREQHPGVWPAAFGGAELYGQDPHGDAGNEVLLGRGVVLLIDPQDPGRVGEYTLLFYEECSSEPILRLPIGPRLQLSQQPSEPPAMGGSRRSTVSRRLTYGGDRLGPANCAVATAFDLTMPGTPGWALCFDMEIDGESFARDFRVRKLLTALSLRTARGRSAIGNLQEEMMGLRRCGLCSLFFELARYLLLMVLVSGLAYAATLYSADPERPLVELFARVLQEMAGAAAGAVGQAADFGAAACGVLLRSIPAAEVERCAQIPSTAEARVCMANLVAAV